jgi:protein phosphatase
MITDREILDVVKGCSENLESACLRLVTMANEHGGEDNITAVVIRVEDDVTDRKIELSKTMPLTPRASGTDEDTPPAAAAKIDQPPPSRP